MITFTSGNLNVTIDEIKGKILSLVIGKKELLVEETPIFNIRLRNRMGDAFFVSSLDAKDSSFKENTIEFSKFDSFDSLLVKVIIDTCEGISWKIEAYGVSDSYAIEYIEFPKVCLPKLIDNNENGGKILFPYDEGILVSDEKALPRYEAEFPMSGAHFIFPNKICSQFLAYLFNDCGLYIGAHDTKRGFKGVDFCPTDKGVILQMRPYSGCDFGMDFVTEYPIIFKSCKGDWKSAANIYRIWFEENLPENLVKISENKSLPNWYKELPLIVTYPVRGTYDMDKMEPNRLYPYTNALPIIDKIKSDTGSQIMALLMHWEGTAPWAPPYVWPPYGGITKFNEFKNELHKNGNLLGVYCSGFGYTKQSTLIEEYNLEEKIEKENVLEGVCHSPKNKPELGITCCPYQRYGYDICPASSRGREILDEAYKPLFESGVDYSQILDQNHGGGQYMCYAHNHSHPPMPGVWMTTNMQKLLSSWNILAPNMLFGCESAAAEPFIGSLLMSDNRFELNYTYGEVVPLYAFLYHPFVRNFMGNQCGCPFEPKIDTLRYRLAYSFSIGDFMTLILNQDGKAMSHWGSFEFEVLPDMEKSLLLIKNLTKFYNEKGKKYLYNGKMSVSPYIECEKITIPLTRGKENSVLPRLLCSSWENGDNSAYVIVNPEENPVKFTLNGKEYVAKELDAMLIE